jgi:hypothetical protein
VTAQGTNGHLIVNGEIAVDGRKFPALRRALERGRKLLTNGPAACAVGQGIEKTTTEDPMATKTKSMAKKTKGKKTAKPMKAAKSSKERDPRLPAPGSVIEREYKGKKYEVKVLATGFEFEGEVYASLSALAKKITGADSINGLLFFRLTTPKPVEAK